MLIVPAHLRQPKMFGQIRKKTTFLGCFLMFAALEHLQALVFFHHFQTVWYPLLLYKDWTVTGSELISGL